MVGGEDDERAARPVPGSRGDASQREVGLRGVVDGLDDAVSDWWTTRSPPMTRSP